MSEFDFGASTSSGWIGLVIDDRYCIKELIGEGGMGAVFVAEHLTLHKDVALKIVRPEHGQNKELTARFAREAMVTSRLEHPNVISAIDYGQLDTGEAFLAMQLVRGSSLKEIREHEGNIHWSRAAALGAQIADALMAAATLGIVHRDLKPDNILVQRMDDGTELAKVLDFGIAKFSRDSLAPPPLRGGQAVTEIGVVIGTPGYMAPEQAVGRKADHRSDLYSLGVILWECIAGRLLWEGDDVQTIVQNQLRNRPPSLRAHTGDLTIPEELDELILSLLKDFPGDRPSDVGAVRDALREVAGGTHGVAGGFRSSATSTRDTPKPGISTAKRAIASAERASRIDEPAPVPAPVEAPTTPVVTPLSTQTPHPSRAPRRGTIWGAIAALLLGGAAVLIFMGQLEVRPKGDLEKVTSTLVPPTPVAAQRGTNEPPPPEPEPAAEALDPDLPGPLIPIFGTLVQSEKRAERVEAAKALIGHVPMDEVPRYARYLAHFQLAETCLDKKAELDRIVALDDPRVLPMLVLTSERGKKGCGPKGKKDCLGCMREQMDALVESLRLRQNDVQPAPAE